MVTPLVSVFIPAYNCEEYIIQSVESMLNQTYENIEVIIVDDGSSDNTVSLINSLNDDRIRLYQNTENKGIPYTRNRGLGLAKGKYMAIMDADDIAYPTRIAKQVEFLEKHTDHIAIGSYYDKQFESGKTRTIKLFANNHAMMKYMLMFFDPISNPSAMVRLEPVKMNNIVYNEQYFVAQDYDFWLKLIEYGKLGMIQEPLITYRSGHANITARSKNEKLAKRNKIIGEIQKDALRYFGIYLDDVSLKTFNTIFSQTPASLVDLSTASKLHDQIKSWYSRLSSKEKSAFLKVYRRAIVDGISYQDGNLGFKMKLYQCMQFKFNIKDMTYLILKTILKAIR